MDQTAKVQTCNVCAYLFEVNKVFWFVGSEVYTIFVNEQGQQVDMPQGPTVQQHSMVRDVEADACGNQYTTWSSNHSKVLIDLYKEYRGKVGTFQIKTVKKLWEVISSRINAIFMLNLSAQNCENRWRVLDRGYKKFVDNKTKTGRGRKFFEFEKEMEDIFQKKKNIHPEIVLSSETLDYNLNVTNKSSEPEEIIEQAHHSPSSSKSPRRKKITMTRNEILDQIRKDRYAYQQERCQIEREKLEVKKQMVTELKRRNDLVEERNKSYI